MERRKLMLKQKFTAVLATAAALVLLAVPAFAASRSCSCAAADHTGRDCPV